MEMKIEPEDVNNTVAQYSNTKTQPFCTSDISPSLVPYLEIQIDETNIKTEEEDAESINSNDDHDDRSEIQLPRLPPEIKMSRVPLHRKNDVHSVCYGMNPTCAEKKRQKVSRKQTKGQIVKRKNSDESNIKNNKSIINNSLSVNSIEFVDVKSHEDKDSSKKTLKCEHCNFACVHRSTMKLHKMIHSGEKPLKCKDCDYSCIRSTDMRLHKMIHSGEKPLKCEDCDYSCIQSSNMNKHKMIHSEEKPYKCDNCNYSCKFSANMKTHRTKHCSNS